jgi:hypothetical protein
MAARDTLPTEVLSEAPKFMHFLQEEPGDGERAGNDHDQGGGEQVEFLHASETLSKHTSSVELQKRVSMAALL